MCAALKAAGNSPFQNPPDADNWWGDSLTHLEFAIVTKPFTREEMELYDPDWAHTIHYAAHGRPLQPVSVMVRRERSRLSTVDDVLRNLEK